MCRPAHRHSDQELCKFKFDDAEQRHSATYLNIISIKFRNTKYEFILNC